MHVSGKSPADGVFKLSKHSKSHPVVFNEERKKQAVDIFIRSNYSVQSSPSHSLTRETESISRIYVLANHYEKRLIVFE